MAEEVRGGRERDLVLAPNEFAFILDETKGYINTYVGPHKTSLANTDRPVIFASKKFKRCELHEAIQGFAIAPEGWYLELKNPAKDGKHPEAAKSSLSCELNIGHKVNIAGPTSFPLWPGQMARVIKGHHLRNNQYLLTRIYDSTSLTGVEGITKEENITGNLFIIKGTDVSFYIPPSGIEVVPEILLDTTAKVTASSYVRDAVTLERLEYCVLLDEEGNKRYVKGPEVVFPLTTEKFMEKDGSRKFKAIELNEISGLYIKVIADYEEGKKEYKTGDELFITGKDQMIYFPRQEHAIIKYGKQEVHFAIAIPSGEARYVLDRKSGAVKLVEGPAMYLPNPIDEVVVKRILSEGQVGLWYPNNKLALAFNKTLAEMSGGSAGYLAADTVRPTKKGVTAAFSVNAVMGATDSFERKDSFTPPRTVTLDTKYEGVPGINIWTGYAVQVVDKKGQRRVKTGPDTVLIEYDEDLEKLSLSMGTPKCSDKLMETVYLRIANNKVSDVIQVETKDLCMVEVKVAYMVNFINDANKWFNVENYVQYLCDRGRSILKNTAKKYSVEDFYTHTTDIIRDVILIKGEDGKHTGRIFEDNNMLVYDIEVLDISIKDKDISALLWDTTRRVIQQTLKVTEEERNFKTLQQVEALKISSNEVKLATLMNSLEGAITEAESRGEVAITQFKIDAERKLAVAKNAIEISILSFDKTKIDVEDFVTRAEGDIKVAQERLDQKIVELKASTEAKVQEINAVKGEVAAAINSMADKNMVAHVSHSLAPLAILGGNSVADVLNNMLKGTTLEKILERGKEVLSK